MTFKITYCLEKVNIYNEKENGEIKRKHSVEMRFQQEEIDENDICELLALKYRNENYLADELIKITCSID